MKNEAEVVHKELLVEADSFFDEKFKKKMRIPLLLVDIQCAFIKLCEKMRKKRN